MTNTRASEHTELRTQVRKFRTLLKATQIKSFSSIFIKSYGEQRQDPG